MKTIILKIDDDVLGSLRSNINIKMLGGNFAGITDSFIKKLIFWTMCHFVLIMENWWL